MTSNSPVTISPSTDTTYTLTVTNSIGETATSNASISVVAAPEITSFTTTSSPITLGDSSSLVAVFTNGDGTIDNGVGNVVSNIPVTVSPSTTTSYTLTVTNSVGATASSDTTIEVVNGSPSTLVVDHTSIALFDQIPQSYINEVKKRLFILPGESHGQAYGYGLELVETDDPKFNSSTNWNGAAEAYTEQHLRWNRYFLYNNQWISTCGEEEFWTNATARQYTLAGLQSVSNSYSGNIYFGFGWCWDTTWMNSPTASKDPVHGCGWAGSSVDGPDGNLPWGLDDADSSLTGNSVNLQTYLDAVDYYNQNATGVKTIFTTSPVDNETNNERGYQRHLKHEAIRDYVKTNGGILLDYADILSWDYSNNTAFPQSWTDNNNVTHTWNGRNPSLATGGSGYGNSHIGEEGAKLIGKAIWIMLALDAGWDGR